ncbi:lactonase family protein [Mucilaginibacter antarcticus]|uniref:lactonase family protein n=1 Tax=Mucilaginibacter antarcticus TaxID=1855725 RepID=UPI00362EDC95
MKKRLLLALLLLPLFCLSQGKIAKVYNMVIGTRTHGASDGIYVYRFNIESGKITYLNHVAGIANPTYLCVSANNKFIYAVSDKSIGSGNVYAYKFNAATGQLDSLNNRSAFGGPLYVSVDKAQKTFLRQLSGRLLSVYPLNADGSLGEVSQVIQSSGNSINRLRQEAPHLQSAIFSPDEKHLLTTDLGTDRLNIYKYNATAQEVLSPAPLPFVNGNPGYGPRHAVFSGDGRFVYMLQELSGTITVYSFNKGRPVTCS